VRSTPGSFSHVKRIRKAAAGIRDQGEFQPRYQDGDANEDGKLLEEEQLSEVMDRECVRRSLEDHITSRQRAWFQS
jgi:hypothetical protein